MSDRQRAPGALALEELTLLGKRMRAVQVKQNIKAVNINPTTGSSETIKVIIPPHRLLQSHQPVTQCYATSVLKHV